MRTYLNYCKLKGLTPTTINSYRVTISQFLRWCDQRNLICEVGAANYAEHLYRKSILMLSTQLVHIRRINGYLSYTHRRPIPIPARLRQKPVNGSKRIRSAFSMKELGKIFYTILSPKYGRRFVTQKVGDVVLLSFMLVGVWNTQLLARVSVSDIDFSLCQLSHPNSNSNIPLLEFKNVNFGYDFIEYLNIWVNNLPPGGMLFTDLTQKDIDNLYRRIKKYSGISVTRNKLKTTSATLLMCSGIPPYLIAIWMGISEEELTGLIDSEEVRKKFDSIRVISAAYPLISPYQLKKEFDDKE